MNFWKKIKAYLPVLAALLVAVCVGISLQGYEPVVYAVQMTDVQQDADDPDDVDDKTASSEELADEETEVVKGSFDLADGIYEGSGTGFAGTVKVAVEIQDHTITAITIVSTVDDAAFFNRAQGVIDKIIAGQTLDVDVVSGATYSSNGIIRAVKNALLGETDDSEPVSVSEGSGSTTVSQVADVDGYIDGTYYGSGTGFAGKLSVKVVVSDGKISAITITDTSDGSSYISKAKSVINRIIASQSTNVDTASGATYSSVGIIEAVRDALKNAAADGSTDTVGSDNNQETDADEVITIQGKVPYKNGIYKGVGDGYLGDVEVCIVIQNKTIKAIWVTDTVDDEAFFNRARAVITEVLKSQSTDVDTVSGATFSSEGILEAIEEALKAADEATNGKKPETDTQPGTGETETPGQSDGSDSTDTTVYTDGDYQVTVMCEPDEDNDFERYKLSMTVTLNNDRITAITDISGDGASSNNSYIKRAANGTSKIPGVVTQIIEKGMPDNIDTVSGATCTSKSILEACRQVLDAAKKK